MYYRKSDSVAFRSDFASVIAVSFRSDCVDVQSELELHFPHFSEGVFSRNAAHMFLVDTFSLKTVPPMSWIMTNSVNTVNTSQIFLRHF